MVLAGFCTTEKGNMIVDHGGNIDGFTAEVAFMPDHKLGFALLTNANNSPLGGSVVETVFSNLVDDPSEQAASASKTNNGVSMDDPQKEVGTYPIPGAPVSIDVVFKEGKLYMAVPGQPQYVMEKVEGRKYKLGSPAPDGFYATFRPASTDAKQTELFLQQPQGDLVIVRSGANNWGSDNGAVSNSSLRQEFLAPTR